MIKILVRLFLPIFTVWALFAPARAYAIVPLIVAAARISAAVLKTPTGQQLFVNAPIGIGLAYSIFSVTRTDGTNTRQDDFYLSDAPRAPSAVEAGAGWTQSPSASSPVPPTNAGVPVYNSWDVGWQYAGFVTSVAACHAAFVGYGLATTHTETAGYFVSVSQWNCGWKSKSTGVVTLDYSFGSASCPSGYSLSGSACNLTNAGLVQKPTDNICPIVRNGTAYAVDANDPDCANGQAPTLSTTAAGGGLAVVPSFNGDSANIERRVDGSWRIGYWVADPATNTTKGRDVTLSPGATSNDPPVVSGVTDSILSGTGSSAGGTVSTTTDPATAAAVAANTAAINELKTELAATGEAATVTGAAVTGAAALAQSYAGQAADVTQRAGGFGLPSLPGFLFPQFSSPVCAPIGWTFQGRSVSFDMCPHVSTIKSIAAWVLNLLAAAICFQMLMNFRAMRVRG